MRVLPYRRRQERRGLDAVLPYFGRGPSSPRWQRLMHSARQELVSTRTPIEGIFGGAGIGDRHGLGIDDSGRDTEDRTTSLDVRMAVRTVAAVPPPLWKLYSQRIGKLRPALRCLKTMHVP